MSIYKKKANDITIEDLQEHSLRVDLDSIKAAGYNKSFARKYLFDRFVNLDSYITASKFNEVLNEVF